MAYCPSRTNEAPGTSASKVASPDAPRMPTTSAGTSGRDTAAGQLLAVLIAMLMAFATAIGHQNLIDSSSSSRLLSLRCARCCQRAKVPSPSSEALGRVDSHVPRSSMGAPCDVGQRASSPVAGVDVESPPKRPVGPRRCGERCKCFGGCGSMACCGGQRSCSHGSTVHGEWHYCWQCLAVPLFDDWPLEGQVSADRPCRTSRRQRSWMIQHGPRHDGLCWETSPTVATDNVAAWPLASAQAAHLRITSCMSSSDSDANAISSATVVCRRINAHFMSDTDMSDNPQAAG